MNLKSILKKTFINISRKKNSSYKKSYSQCGEDIIVNYIFSVLKIKNINYIDIGANDPYKLNNTALFYENGNSGINIEPDPQLFNKFKKYRKKDINLNLGISEKNEYKDFYIMSSPTMNTFLKKEANELVKKYNFKILKTIKVKTKTINNIIKKYSKNKKIDFLTLDTEGYDETILHSINFSLFKPTIICVETATYSETGEGKKEYGIINFLKEKGYLLYADTNINSIFVDKNKWIRKKCI